MAGTQAGGRPPLVCFHLSPMSGRVYERFIGAMSANRLAIAIDTPGFGMSDAPPVRPSIADYSRAMRAAVAALGIQTPIDLMGYHTGSMIAADLAAEHQALVRRLILVSAPIFTEAEREQLRQRYAPLTPSLDGSHLVKRWTGYVHHYLGRGLMIEDLADMFPDGLLGRNLAWWGHNAAFAFTSNMRLPELRQPILVLNPGDDLQQESRRATALLRNGRLVELPSWGHGFLDGFTADAARLASGFLDSPDADPFAGVVIPSSALDSER